MIARQGRGQKILNGEDTGAQTVIDIVTDIGDIVGQRRQLRFQPRPAGKLQRPAFVET